MPVDFAVRILVEEGGIIRCMVCASTVIFNKFVTKIFIKKAVGFVAGITASTKEQRIIRICILGAICIFHIDANQDYLRSFRTR